MAVSSLFAHDTAPQNGTYTPNEVGTYALGVVVRPNVNGTIGSVWYYVGAAGLGSIGAIAHVYPYVVINTVPDGEESFISQGFTLRNTVGWQQVVFSSPVPVMAATRYMISVSFPSTGVYYTEVPNVFASDVTSGDITAESRAAVGNGRYSDIGSDTLRRQYPMKNWSAASYCVDIDFHSAPPATTHFRVTDDFQLSPMSVTSII